MNITLKYSNYEIENFDDNHDFIDASVELHKQTIALLWTMAGIIYCDENQEPKEITKDEAVTGGNLVRLIKLNTSFLQNACGHKLEICYIINRCISETYINLKYLLQNSEEKVTRNYIKHSLITEKELEYY
ncbi:MAG TPA: DUF5677 domain-containing protein [Ferruginibacter sp.]|nr:DUF5677 domain-containing protein [Ferruginibacter sp.]